MNNDDAGAALLLDQWIPAYEFAEVHTVLALAPRKHVFLAAKQVTPIEIPTLRLLFAVRSLPHLLRRGGRLPLQGAEPVLDQMVAAGFVVLGEEVDREIVLGVVGQFWKLSGAPVPLRDASEFSSYSRDDFAKAAINFRFHETASGGCVLRTETRVTVPNAAARRRFAVYWRFIGPASSLIRRSWLRAVKRRAEAHEVAT